MFLNYTWLRSRNKTSVFLDKLANLWVNIIIIIIVLYLNSLISNSPIAIHFFVETEWREYHLPYSTFTHAAWATELFRI